MPDEASPLAALDVPFGQFATWLEEAMASEPNDANAMVLATATPDGRPSARTVLLKGWDQDGFVFYTNTLSRKGGELAANRHACLLFHWKSRRRQIRIEGPVVDATAAEADAYFASRPRISRLGAHASDQSRPLPARAVLEARLAEAEARFPGEDIPRPDYWSGYRVVPAVIEFWQDMPFRLHDRSVYTRLDQRGDGAAWSVQKLFP